MDKEGNRIRGNRFFLRFMTWLCLRNNDYRNSQMCIVTGPNIDIAIKLIKRMKSLFERKLGLTFPSKETVLELNGCRIEAYPSNHIDAYRALDNPKFILLDEADFSEKESRKTSGMSLKDTLQSQTLTLLWFQHQMLLTAYLNT
jgi:hypothetical protein